MRRKLVKLRDALNVLADHEKEVFVPESGICHNLRLMGFDDTMEVFQILAVDWPHYTGDIIYPVPETDYMYPGKWEGKRGEVRRHLCAFVAQEIDRRLTHGVIKQNGARL